MKENRTFESFMVRIRKKNGKWIGNIIYIKKGIEYPIRKISEIPEIIKRFVKEGEKQ